MTLMKIVFHFNSLDHIFNMRCNRMLNFIPTYWRYMPCTNKTLVATSNWNINYLYKRLIWNSHGIEDHQNGAYIWNLCRIHYSWQTPGANREHRDISKWIRFVFMKHRHWSVPEQQTVKSNAFHKSKHKSDNNPSNMSSLVAIWIKYVWHATLCNTHECACIHSRTHT